MNFWRMAMRVGAHGDDMWPQCRDAGVAAITYDGIETTDLRGYSLSNKPRGWTLTGSQPGSINAFAWTIAGGDAIYVRDSAFGGMVGFGYVRAPLGALAYRFDGASQIREPRSGTAWHHLIDVDWDLAFVPFRYQDRSANTTVLRLLPDEVTKFGRSAAIDQHQQNGLSKDECERALLIEDAYPRSSPATARLIERLHARLSNDFRKWLRKQHGVGSEQERARIDLTFEWKRKNVLTEFKIAYGANTRAAIREGLGQVLEYNHYPCRHACAEWLLVLDTAASKDDCEFIGAVRKQYSVPITLGWKNAEGFEFFPRWLP